MMFDFRILKESICAATFFVIPYACQMAATRQGSRLSNNRT